jgi:hypothetical protein
MQSCQEHFAPQKGTTLEHELTNLKVYAAGLETGLQDASLHEARLERLLEETRSQAAKLNKALQAEQAHVNHLLERLGQPQADSALGSTILRVQHFSRWLREAGNRLTGGGLRSLAKRIATRSQRYIEQHSHAKTVARSILKSVPKAAAYLSGIEAKEADEALKSFLAYIPDERARYSRWVAVYDTINDADRSLIRAHISSLTFRPLISVIISTSERSEIILRQSFNSVATQLYPDWELCVAVDELLEPRIESLLSSCMADSARLKLIRTGTAITPASGINDAISRATGEFVTFLQAGDLLSEHALYEVAVALGGDKQQTFFTQTMMR